MNYCEMTTNGTVDTTERERENMKTLMRQTNERLHEAVESAERILSEVRGAFPRKEDEPPHVASVLDAQRINRDMAERVCAVLKELAMQMGVEQ